MASITDNCSHLSTYPVFGKICVTGSSWAAASVVAADPLHLDVFSNGRTTKVVGPSNQFGLEWQCTELAVRWAAAAWGEGNKKAWDRAGWNGAAQSMWGVGPHLPKPLQQVPNGSSQAPQMGDLIIFHEPKGVTGPGHVAIVLSVNRSTGKLTFIGENQYKAPAVVQVPISPTNHVSASGFANLTVTGWLSHGPISPGWTATKAALPAGAATNPQAGLEQVSCASATACAAVGSYIDSSGNWQGLVVTGSGSSWATTKVPLPAGGKPNVFASAVSCPSAAACTATGSYWDSYGMEGLLLTGAGRSWTATEPALGPDPSPRIPSVSCASATACTAVGYYYPRGGQQGLLLTGAGTSWQAMSAPLPTAGGTGTELAWVSCPLATACTAVGHYTTALGYQKGLLLTGAGISWAAAKAPLPPGAATNPQVALDQVSCVSATACTAVGSYTDASGNQQGLLLTGAGKSWTAAKAPLPPDAGANPYAVIASVSCVSATTCTAVGSYDDPSINSVVGVLLTGAGGSWTATEAPLPPGGVGAGPLDSVSCVSATACTAVGFYDDGAGFQGFLLTGAGTSWTATEAPLPPGGGSDKLYGVSLPSVSCTSATACTAVGSYGDPSDHSQALLLSGPG